jgi:hypothetical protein
VRKVEIHCAQRQRISVRKKLALQLNAGSGVSLRLPRTDSGLTNVGDSAGGIAMGLISPRINGGANGQDSFIDGLPLSARDDDGYRGA